MAEAWRDVDLESAWAPFHGESRCDIVKASGAVGGFDRGVLCRLRLQALKPFRKARRGIVLAGLREGVPGMGRKEVVVVLGGEKASRKEKNQREPKKSHRARRQ